MISTLSFCHTPTQLYVVPKSIPIAGPSRDIAAGYLLACSCSLYVIKAQQIVLRALSVAIRALKEFRLHSESTEFEAAPYLYRGDNGPSK
jgi:hypothetical protein